MDIMDDNYAENFAGQIREMMENFDLPYLKITVEDISVPYADSKTPLTVLSAKIEALVNALLWDAMSANMSEAGFILSQLEDHVDSLISLSAYLRLEHDIREHGEEESKENPLAPIMPYRKAKKKKPPKPEPIPQIFSDTLKEIQDKKAQK